jgi:AcrR family transcriptional regulator
MGHMSVTDRPLRADAERNRQRIIAAAASVFAERGLDVSLDEIAHAAGVGVGTVYRRFPDKDALIDALFETKIAALEQLTQDALAMEDPWEGFVHFMRGMSRSHAKDRGLKECIFSADRGRERAERARQAIAPVAAQLLERAQAQGRVRADVVATDMPLMHFAVGYIADAVREISPDSWERLLTIFLDGLAAQREGTTPLPAAPLTPEQFAAAISRRH